MTAAQTEVRLPLMGEGVHEATVVRWLKQPGDPVKDQEPLLEVATDKVDTELVAPGAGYLQEVLAQEGDVITVDQLIAIITPTLGGGVTTSGAEAAPTHGGGSAVSRQTERSREAIKPLAAPQAPLTRSSPVVRKMAREHGIDLQNVPGTGLGQRITKRDLIAYQQQQAATQGSGGSAQVAMEAPPQALEVTSGRDRQGAQLADLSAAQLPVQEADGKKFLDGVEVEPVKMSRMRRLIAEHMVASVRTSPHVTTVFEIDMDQVVRSRGRHKGVFAKKEGFNLTYTPYLIAAAVKALKAHPIVNTSLSGDEILYKKDINIGCAVALDDGLIVPVIKQAGELSLLGIARRLNDLVDRARSKRLQPNDITGGTFSITNPGGYGSIVSAPIINQPQVAILGIGAIVKRPVIVDDMIAIRPVMQASLTFDHRVIDGEGGANYLATFKSALESGQEDPC